LTLACRYGMLCGSDGNNNMLRDVTGVKMRRDSRFITTREIIRGKGMSCSFLLSAGARNLQARFGVANGLEASSNTTNVRPHEFLDHTGKRRAIEVIRQGCSSLHPSG